MKSLDSYESAPYDVHLMIEDPDKYIQDFVTEKTEFITVHQEACIHLNRTIEHIKSYGVSAGVSLNPATPVSTLENILSQVDLVLIMSVNPGFGGQSFIEETLTKVKKLVDIREKMGYNWVIEIDGGVNLKNAKAIADAGVDILVAGSAVFGANDVEGCVKEFKTII